MSPAEPETVSLADGAGGTARGAAGNRGRPCSSHAARPAFPESVSGGIPGV